MPEQVAQMKAGVGLVGHEGSVEGGLALALGWLSDLESVGFSVADGGSAAEATVTAQPASPASRKSDPRARRVLPSQLLFRRGLG